MGSNRGAFRQSSRSSSTSAIDEHSSRRRHPGEPGQGGPCDVGPRRPGRCADACRDRPALRHDHVRGAVPRAAAASARRQPRIPESRTSARCLPAKASAGRSQRAGCSTLHRLACGNPLTWSPRARNNLGCGRFSKPRVETGRLLWTTGTNRGRFQPADFRAQIAVRG